MNRRFPGIAFTVITILLSGLTLVSPVNAASTTLVPVTALPTSYDYKAVKSYLSLSFDLPNDVSPSQGATATWGAVPQFRNSQGDSVVFDATDEWNDWSLQTRVTGNRATYTVGFHFNSTYKIIFWAKIGSTYYTYVHNIVVTGSAELNEVPNLSVNISYTSQNTQAIITVKRNYRFIVGDCLGLLKASTYQKLIDQNRPIDDFYSGEALGWTLCQINFDSNGEASFPMDMTAYQNANNDVHLVHFFNPGHDGGWQGLAGNVNPRVFRSYPLQLTFVAPKNTPTINCEELFREKASKCTLTVNAINALGAKVYLGEPVTTSVIIKKSTGDEVKIVSGKFGGESIFYIGPDSQEESLSIKYVSETPYTYTVKPHSYELNEMVDISWNLECKTDKKIASCVATNTSYAKVGFLLPATIPLTVSTKTWSVKASEIQESVIYSDNLAINGKYQFKVNADSLLSEIGAGNSDTDLSAVWSNPSFILPITIDNSSINLDCPSNIKGSTITCTLQFATSSNTNASQKISIENKNSKTNWKTIKTVGVVPNKSSKVVFPNNLDSQLHVRASASIGSNKLVSSTSDWVKNSPITNTLTKPQTGIRGSSTYLSTYSIMARLANSLPYPFTAARIASYGGITGYCTTLEAAGEADAGVNFKLQDRLDWVLACTDYLKSH